MSSFTQQRWAQAEELTFSGVQTLMNATHCSKSHMLLISIMYMLRNNWSNLSVRQEIDDQGNVVVAMMLSSKIRAWQLAGPTKLFRQL